MKTLLALVGCSTLAPAAKEVRLTRDAAAVERCHPLGAVVSDYPDIMLGEDFRQIRAESAALGANTVLLTRPRFVNAAGVAYRCST